MNYPNPIAIATMAAILSIAASGFTQAAMLYDVNNGATSTTNTQAGWIAATPTNGVTFTTVGGGTLNFRDRNTGNTDGASGDTANNDMWRDLFFIRGTAGPVEPGLGVDVTISGLLASTQYNVNVWAWDDSSDNGRTATWNGNLISFPTTGDPTSLNDYVVAFTATTNSSGTLVLQGRDAGGQNDDVYLNGFELSAVTQNIPEPGSLAVLGLGGLMLARRRRTN